MTLDLKLGQRASSPGLTTQTLQAESQSATAHRCLQGTEGSGAGKAGIRVFTTYLVVCKTSNHLYVGHTGNSSKRWRQHRSGKGASFTRDHGVVTIIPIYQFSTRKAASRLETVLTERLRRLKGFVVAGALYTKPMNDGTIEKWTSRPRLKRMNGRPVLKGVTF